MDVLDRNWYELIPHPANSTDLASSNFFYSKWKNDIRGRHLPSDEEVMKTAEGVNPKGPRVFSSGPMALERCWSKCITQESSNIKKERYLYGI